MADEFLKEFPPNVRNNHVIDVYSYWAQTYDEDMTIAKTNYTGPATVAKETAELLGDRIDCKILDLAAGTGKVATELKYKYGFHEIDAVDANKEMLNISKNKGLYKSTYMALLGPNRLPIESNTYDAATLVGAFVPGHVDGTCLEEVIRVLKPGGYFVSVVKDCHLTSGDKGMESLEQDMQRHQKNGTVASGGKKNLALLETK